MVFFRGRCSMIFYMPNKPIKWGFKFHCMVDSKTYYLFDMIFDPGKKYKEIVASNTKESYAKQIVLTLVDKLPEKNHRIFTDSWYSSIELGNELTKRGFSFITTLRANAAGLCDKEKIENSSKHYAYKDKNLILLYKDKKNIYFYTNEKISTEECKKLYNMENRGVDKMDQNISYYNCERRVIKWWKKYIFAGIEFACSNAKIIFEKFNDKKLSDLEFKSLLNPEL